MLKTESGDVDHIPSAPGRWWRGWAVWVVVLTVVVVVAATGLGRTSTDSTSTPPAAAPAPAVSRTVTYLVTGSTTGADITFTNADGTIGQHNGVGVPLARTTGEVGLSLRMRPGAYFSIAAQNTNAAGDITCTVQVDGVAVTTHTATGGYAIAECAGTVY